MSWNAILVQCSICNERWAAVAPAAVAVKNYQCPKCGQQGHTFIPDDTEDPETTKADWWKK